MKKYELLADRLSHKAGEIVYEFQGHDYGVSRDDTRVAKKLHITVTAQSDGGYPFFTVPVDHLKEIENGGT